jgi:hypothetical protein
MLHRCHPRFLLLVLLFQASSCVGNMSTPKRKDGGASNSEKRLIIKESDGPRPLDTSIIKDTQQGGLPNKPGDPCQNGKCADTLICMANTCRNKCTVPTPDCNQAVAPCTAEEYCIIASSFSGACLPAQAKEGEVCSDTIKCPGGTRCVMRENMPETTKCRRICQNGEACPLLSECKGPSFAGCYICYESY